MYSNVLSLVVLAAVQGVIAIPQPEATTTYLGTLPGDDKCATPTTTVSVTRVGPVCLIACIEPTSSCSAGEPTGPTPNPPVTTTEIDQYACTATVSVRDNPGCGLCATCTSAGLDARATTLPGHKWCPTPTTVSTTVAVTSEICECPFVPATCSDGGYLTTSPLPTSTLTEGCTVSVVAGPADCSNICPTCAYPARVMARATTTLPGEKWCPTPTTVSTTVGPQSTEICACGVIPVTCSSGQPTVKPLPTSTLTEGCTVSVVAGPGDCSNVCPTCAD